MRADPVNDSTNTPASADHLSEAVFHPAAIDALVRAGCEDDYLEDCTRVVYVSPLKALSNDIERNLQQPIQGIRDALLARGIADVEVTTAVRSGDTTARERDKMRRTAPHILVTTPESLHILLTSDSGRRMLGTARTVILDWALTSFRR